MKIICLKKFYIKNIVIDNIKILKNKHILIIFKNDLSMKLRGIFFNSFNTESGDYICKYHKYKFDFLCSIKRDYFTNSDLPQIQIIDMKVLN